jgi:hypothetical protein
VESKSPALSTATHSVCEAHETACRWPGWLLASVQPPLAGLVLVNTLPASSTATHSEALGQETPVSPPPPGTEDGDQVAALGPTLANTLPALSTTTQRPPGAQETAFSEWPGSLNVALQVGLGLVGLEVLNPAPWWFTATHSDSEAHETAVGVPPPGIAVEDQVIGDAARADAGASEAHSASATVNAERTMRVRWRGFAASGVWVLVMSVTTLRVSQPTCLRVCLLLDANPGIGPMLRFSDRQPSKPSSPARPARSSR